MNKITIIHSDDARRMEIARLAAEAMGINYIDIQDYVLRGCVLHGDLDEPSRELFYKVYDEDTYDFLEHISYVAYANSVSEPFVISIDKPQNPMHTKTLKSTISVHIKNDKEPPFYSLIADYAIDDGENVVDEIVKAITADDRWTNEKEGK